MPNDTQKMASLPLPMSGSCYCKKLTYILNATPIFTNCCHCRTCQSLSGSAFAVNVMVESGAVNITSDRQPIEKQHDAVQEGAPSNKTYHCEACGTLIYATIGYFGGGLVFLRAGTLDESEYVVPDAHFFIRSKHPWIQIPDGVRTFETMPGEKDGSLFQGEAQKRFEAAKGLAD